MDPETRRVFTRLMAQAVTLGFGNVIDWVRGRREGSTEGDWATMSPEKRQEMLDAAMNGKQAEPGAAAEPKAEPQAEPEGDAEKGTESDLK